jgi:uncharacterized protein YndB with AHSA1/START domain
MTTVDLVTATVRIAAPPEVVFTYFTDPRLIVEWIADHAELEPEPGGTFALSFGTTIMQGRYLELDPPHRVVFTWGFPDNDVLPVDASTVEVVLQAEGRDTVVELVHRGLPDHERAKHQEGWEECLARLVTAAG